MLGAATALKELAKDESPASRFLIVFWYKGLYMAAPVAARHSPILRAFYLPLRAAGKPAKVALTATMGKLSLVLNSALKPKLNYA